MTSPHVPSSSARPVRLAYLVSHPIQYQAPLLRRIAREPDIELTVLFGSDFSVRAYKDEGFGVSVNWDTPLLEGYRSEFLKPLRDSGGVSATTPISHNLRSRLSLPDGSPAFDALWVHGYASVNALQGILWANAAGIPVLLRAESWMGDRPRSAMKRTIKSLFLRDLASLVSATLPIGSLNASYWDEYFGRRVPQFPMPYAVDNSYFAGLASASTPNRAALRSELGLDAGRPVILFASKLQTRKHADHLITAYAAYIAGMKPEPTPYLVIVGDGEERANLQAQTLGLGLRDVRFAGFQNQSELPRFFDLADVFVLPSRHEPWGLIVNEAMAAGCAVIVSTDVGAHADLVTPGREGFTFAPGDIPALTRALEAVFATPDTPRIMGDAARLRMQSWSFEEDVRGLRAALAHTTRKLRP